MYKGLFLLLIVMLPACTWFDTLPDTRSMQITAINSRERSEYAKLHADLLHIQNTLENKQYKAASEKLKKDMPISHFTYVYFSNKSRIFKPSPSEEMTLLPYIGKAKSIEIRSRSDYFDSDEASEKIALDRAWSIKRYLVARGVNSSTISIHYAVNDDSMGEEEENALYAKNSPVAIELFFE